MQLIIQLRKYFSTCWCVLTCCSLAFAIYQGCLLQSIAALPKILQNAPRLGLVSDAKLQGC